MGGLKRKELLDCWPASSKTEGEDMPGEDNLSEDDFVDKEKETKNSRRWGHIWMQRVAKENAQEEEGQEDKEKMKRKRTNGTKKRTDGHGARKWQ